MAFFHHSLTTATGRTTCSLGFPLTVLQAYLPQMPPKKQPQLPKNGCGNGHNHLEEGYESSTGNLHVTCK